MKTMKKPAYIVEDNGGASADRYCLLVRIYGDTWDIYNMSENAMAPDGINGYNCTLHHNQPAIAGAIISYDRQDIPAAIRELPEQVQRAVRQRLAEYTA